jgi:flagellar secretion chaperone FliS
MNQQDVAALYREISANGANPPGAVVKLYDRILEDFRRASHAISAKNIELRVSCLNHALLIIAELEGVLDFERGGEVAKHLQGFYRVIRGLILQANIRATRQSLEELSKLVAPVRDAWQQVEQDAAHNKVSAPERPQPQIQRPAPRNAAANETGPELELESTGSRWSA